MTRETKRKGLTLGKAEYTKLLFALVFIGMVFIPLLRMFSYMDMDSVKRVVNSHSFSDAVVHSLVSALLGTVITVVLAFAESLPVIYLCGAVRGFSACIACNIPITVTINQSDWGESGKSFTKDGVTVSVGNIDRGSGNLMGGGTFSTTLGNFTRIVVTTGSCEASGTGWSGSYSSQTWAGTPASTVSFSGNFMGMGMVQTTFVCTIALNN